MQKAIIFAVCGFQLASTALAQTSTEVALRGFQAVAAAEARAMRDCATTRLVAPVPVYNRMDKREEMSEAVISLQWSGGCADGKRDGQGVLTWRTERFAGVGPAAGKITTSWSAEGRMVKGERLGMWCVTKFDSGVEGSPPIPRPPLANLGCSLWDGHTKIVTPQFIKQADGRWQEYVMGNPGDTVLAAGELEARSAKMLAAAQTEAVSSPAQVVVQTQTLDDLVRGSKIALAISNAPVPLKDKRVAIVLSSRSGEELERFKRERQALIEASANLSGEAAAEREKFIRASNPGLLLASVLKVVQKHARVAEPADDLSGLQSGRFDYALVIDWKSITRFDLLGKYKLTDWPEKGFGTVSGVSCDVLTGYLIGRDLRAIKQLPGIPMCQSDISTSTGDQAYMWILATAFVNRWGNDLGKLGYAVLGLDAMLKY